MPITENKVVSFDYELKNDAGELLDSSQGREPLTYLHGARSIIPGLEAALEGREVGEDLKVTVPAADAYGERNEALTAEAPRTQFDMIDDLKPGMQFRVPTGGDNYQVATVVEVRDETVLVDANHPLAGVDLHFDVQVRDVRDATADEISQGKATG